MDRRKQIEAAILGAFKGPKADWPAIMESVKGQVKVRSNGWLEVRSVLQKLKDEGTLVRDLEDNYQTEVYRRIYPE